MEMRRHVTRGHPCIYFLYWKRAAGSRNPMLRLTIRSVQHVQEPIHLRLSKFTQGLMLVPLYQARRQLIWRGHALHQASKNDQTGMCVEHTKGRHMCPALAMEAYRECCHCSSHSSSLSEMSTSEEQRCVRAQSNCLLALSDTSLVITVEKASSLIYLFMFTMIHFTVCVVV